MINKYVRIIALVLAVVWMFRIFSFSSDDAEESGMTSRSMSYNLIEKVSRHLGLGWDEDKIEAVSKPAEKIIRKVAHMYEYAVLSLLLGIAADAWRYMKFWEGDPRGARRLKRMGIVAGICLIYAFSDEFHQLFVDGRSGEIRDVMLDFGGVLIAQILAALCVFLYFRKRRPAMLTGSDNAPEEIKVESDIH